MKRQVGIAAVVGLLLSATACSVEDAPDDGATTAPSASTDGSSTSSPGTTDSDADTATSTASSSTDEAGTTSAAPVPPPDDSCAALASRLPVATQVGELFMVGVDTGVGATPQLAALLKETRTGQVVLLGDTTLGVGGVADLVAGVRDAAPTSSRVELLVAADQEGGQVQRLRGGGFDRIPAAVDQSTLPTDQLRREVARWGEQLRTAGIDMDLAPVADVVPEDRLATNEPIGVLGRQYGTTAERAAPRVVAFLEGMQDARVGTSLKHFPGLGHVVGNTDFTPDVSDDVVDADDPGLEVFREGIAAGADSVMIATASYELIDPGVPAAFSPVVIEDMLRGDLGFEGVVISDDLGAARQVEHLPPGERALGFLTAGGDVVINGNQAIHAEMVSAVLERAEQDPDFAQEVVTKATRVLELKASLRLADCSATTP